MVRFRRFRPLFALAVLLLGPPVLAAGHSPTRPLWVTGYYPAWQDDLTLRDIDFKPLTDIIYFALVPTRSGGLDAHANGVNDATAKELASRAHAAGVKALICVGGEGSANAYRRAVKRANRRAFVLKIVDWVAAHHYDGVDIDFEPMKPADTPDFQAFIRELRAAMDRQNPNLVITAAVECGGSPQIFKPIERDFAQLNLMTYDMAGEWSHETWYNSPLTNGALLKNRDGDVLPATDQFVGKWLTGVRPSKLGIGVCCEGRIWHDADDVDEPRRGHAVDTITYRDIVNKYYAPDRYHFDAAAEASALVVPEGDENALVVYDDIRDVDAKVAYARKHGLGGIILWELSEEYLPNRPVGHRHPLSTEVRAAILRP